MVFERKKIARNDFPFSFMPISMMCCKNYYMNCLGIGTKLSAEVYSIFFQLCCE